MLSRRRRREPELEAGSWKLKAEYYSYLNASIGSKRAALMAGKSPKKMPMLAENPIPIANDHHGSETGNPDAQWTIRPMLLPPAMPIRPPAEVRNAASMRNCHRI